MYKLVLDDFPYLCRVGAPYASRDGVFPLDFYAPLVDMISIDSGRLRVALHDHAILCKGRFTGGTRCSGDPLKHYVFLEVRPVLFGLLVVRVSTQNVMRCFLYLCCCQCQDSKRMFLFQFQFSKQELVDFLAIMESRVLADYRHFNFVLVDAYKSKLEYLRDIVVHRPNDFLLETPYSSHYGRNYATHRLGATTNHSIFHYASSPGPDLSPPPPMHLYTSSSPVRNNEQITHRHQPTAYLHSPRRGSPPTAIVQTPATPAPESTPPRRVSDHVVESYPISPVMTYHSDSASDLGQTAQTPSRRVSDDVIACVSPVTQHPDGARTLSPITSRDEGKGKGKGIEKSPQHSHTSDRAGGGPATVAKRKKRGRMLIAALHTVELNEEAAMAVVYRNIKRAAALLLKEDSGAVDMVIEQFGDIDGMSEGSDAEHASTQSPVAPPTLVTSGSPAATPSRSYVSESLSSSQSTATDASLIDPFERRDLNQYTHYRLSSPVSPPSIPESDPFQGRVLTQHRLTSSGPSLQSTPSTPPPAPRPRGKQNRLPSSSISSKSSSKDPNPKPTKRVRILEPSPASLRTPTSAQSSKRRWTNGHMSTGGRPPKKAGESRHPEPLAKWSLSTFLDDADRELASSPIDSSPGRKRQRIEEAPEAEDEHMDLAVPANEVAVAEGATSDESVPGTPVIDLTQDSSSDESAILVHDPITFIDLTLESSDEEGDAPQRQNPPDVIDLTGDSSDESQRNNSDDTLVNRA